METTSKTRRFDVNYRIGSRMEGPYSLIVTAKDDLDAIDEFKRDMAGLRTFVLSVTELKR